VVARFDGHADWAVLGSYAPFQHLPRDRRGLERLCPGVSALWAEGNGMYAATARCYLDHAGNAQRTAAALHVHRTTLYWRLANIERLLGLALAEGDDRLRLHLALKFAELVPETADERAVRHLSE
jgi:sugar diacid utilization regulator